MFLIFSHNRPLLLESSKKILTTHSRIYNIPAHYSNAQDQFHSIQNVTEPRNPKKRKGKEQTKQSQIFTIQSYSLNRQI